MKIVFATNNAHKLDEIRRILGNRFEIVSLEDIGCHEEIPETGDTLEANALQKAQYVYDYYGLSCFADDTGLEVEALGGAPGVHSARYAEGTDHDSEANMAKLLRELEGKDNRRAQFRTVICLIGTSPLHLSHEGGPLFFSGSVSGTIAQSKSGDGGFGYDPLFIPEGYDKSFAELGAEVKNKISHRARAVEKLAEYLHSLES